MATTAHLLRLPPELMLRISSYSTTLELGNFRLSCKQVETNLFESFAREFFTKRQFMVEKVSLEALVGIANHKTLAPYLTEVIIGLDTLHGGASTFYHPRNDIGRDVFLATGRARDLLVEAFSKLPNLRSVGLRDYEGNGRTRDGEKAKWRSYGWSLSDIPPYSRDRFAPPDSILPLLLFALSEASVRPTNFEAFLRRTRMLDRSFDLDYLPSGVAPVLSGLRTLLLSLDEGQSFSGQINTGHRHLKNFLQHTPLLEHIRLNFSNMFVTNEGANSFLRWFGTPSGAAHNIEPTPITLDHLHTLDLGMLSAKPETLLQVVSKFAKLKALSLWKVTLTSGKAPEPEDDRRTWSQFLPKLGRAFRAPEEFSSVMIGFVDEEMIYTRAGNNAEIKFATKVSIDKNGEKKFEDPEGKVSYRKRVGSNVQDWLDDLGSRAYTELPEIASSEDSELDDDDEDEDGEGDDDEIIELSDGSGEEGDD